VIKQPGADVGGRIARKDGGRERRRRDNDDSRAGNRTLRIRETYKPDAKQNEDMAQKETNQHLLNYSAKTFCIIHTTLVTLKIDIPFREKSLKFT
jgi:hypothetical protein